MAKIPLPPYRGGLPDLKMEAKTADYQVTKEDSGTIFHTTGATAAVNFTLPPITDGPFYFSFVNVILYEILIKYNKKFKHCFL